MDMKTNLGLVFLLIGAFGATHLVEAQDQRGFISLDCGLVPKDNKYTETTTNITYISDATVIDVGEVKEVGPELKALFQQQLWSLRAFPAGFRNCYNLQNLKKGDRYLIRASFLYGNYDGLNALPSFDVYIGPNLWSIVEIPSANDSSNLELVHVLTSNQLQVCLMKTGPTVPFISSLELRPLGNDTYVTQTGSLMTVYRRSLSSSEGFIRYDEDIHDRSWERFLDVNWRQISTSLPINTSAKYEVPELVMRTAAVPGNANEPLSIFWTDTDKSSGYYAYLHFAEIEILKANETRELVILFNEIGPSEPLSPPNFTLQSLSSKSPLTSENGTYALRIQRTNRSTHPPLLNAYEIYKIIEFTQLETDPNDVDAVKSIAVTYGLNKIDWQGDPCRPEKYLWDGLNCSYSDSDSSRITSLNLSASKLRGPITPYIFNLTQLTTLDLSNNNLIGEVPEFLATMKLAYINLSGNKLNGSIPQALLEKKNEGSLNLITDCESDICHSKPGKRSFVVPLVAAVASLAIVIAIFSVLYIFRRNRLANISALELQSDVTMHVDTQPREQSESLILTKERRFTYSEVTRMTNNFERVIGKGGFGMVYHGSLNDDDQVAVKMLSQSSAQGYKEFLAEVELLLRVHHRNLVSLVGYCDEGDKLALIYEFMPKGDLKTHLSGNSGRNVLSWADRLSIAAEAAQGLDYLHNGCKPQMIHRDVKTANILLNEHFQAKLADFGLSRSFPLDGETHVSTVVAGTPGYLDPEYYLTNWLTEKSDVYSFGIVLLEIITNQRVVDKTRERPHIAEWVKLMANRGDVRSMIDPRLQGDYDINSFWKAIELAMSCVDPSSRKRPAMPVVVMELSGCLEAEMARTRASRDTDVSIGSLG